MLLANKYYKNMQTGLIHIYKFVINFILRFKQVQLIFIYCNSIIVQYILYFQ
jgi:hypothetical protein